MSKTFQTDSILANQLFISVYQIFVNNLLHQCQKLNVLYFIDLNYGHDFRYFTPFFLYSILKKEMATTKFGLFLHKMCIYNSIKISKINLNES